MSEWKKVKLKDICSEIVDCVNKTAPVCDFETPYKMLRTSDIRNGQINREGLKCVTKEVFEKWNRRGYLQKGDIIFTREAPVGEVGWLDNPENLFLGQRLMFFRADFKKCNSRFLFYSLFFRDNKLSIIAKANGSTVNHLRVPECENIEISIPDLPTQTRIATILSRYDSLIENYQKQIKLLEEAAQRLYKEWFVDLRFPGHEKVKVVDGVPEGWANTTIGEIGCSIESGSRPKGGIDNNLTSGYVSVGAENVIGLGKYNYTSEKLISSDFYDNMKRGKIKDRDILIYKDGAYIGRTSLFQDSFPHKAAAVNEHVFLLHANDDNYQYYLFFTLYQKVYFEKMQKLNKNAAQPGINQQLLSGLDLILPTKSLVEQFNSFVTPVLHGIFDYAKQIYSLTESRDRLLPKLMSGEVEV